MARTSRIFVAGHRGFVGSSIMRQLAREGCQSVMTAAPEQLDLRDQSEVNYWFKANRPEYVFLVAGAAGGIRADAARHDASIYDNLMSHATVIHAAHTHAVKKLLYLGGSCIYPRDSAQPMAEETVLSGPLEPTDEPDAVATIAGIKLCQAYRREHGCDFIAAVPASLYGPHDDFDPGTSHVLAAMIRTFHFAKIYGAPDVSICGSGRPRRELMHVDDLAAASLFLMRRYSDPMHINVGTGEEVAICELAALVRDEVYPDARLTFDASEPDGAPRRLLDSTRIRSLGWRHRIPLRQGIADTYAWFFANEAAADSNVMSAEVA